jgi:hypothetical protein
VVEYISTYQGEFYIYMYDYIQLSAKKIKRNCANIFTFYVFEKVFDTCFILVEIIKYIILELSLSLHWVVSIYKS